MNENKTITFYLYDVPMSLAKTVVDDIELACTEAINSGRYDEARNLIYNLELIKKGLEEVVSE